MRIIINTLALSLRNSYYRVNDFSESTCHAGLLTWPTYSVYDDNYKVSGRPSSGSTLYVPALYSSFPLSASFINPKSVQTSTRIGLASMLIGWPIAHQSNQQNFASTCSISPVISNHGHIIRNSIIQEHSY